MFSLEVFAPKLRLIEGGYQCKPSDDGNFNSKGECAGTKYGISARWYESVIGRPPSVSDIKRITWTKALGLYQEYFVEPLLLPQIKSQKAAEVIFDFAVNSGVQRAVKSVQVFLANSTGAELYIDGIMGAKTIAAINLVEEKELVNGLFSMRKEFYRAIVERKPEKIEWFYGWIRRLVVSLEGLTVFDAEFQALKILSKGLIWHSESESEMSVTDIIPFTKVKNPDFTTFYENDFDKKMLAQKGFSKLLVYLQFRFTERYGFAVNVSQSNKLLCFVVANRRGTFYLFVDVVES